jgi:hypothetical protein
MIRLPQEYTQIIGQKAHVYKTDHNGEPAFLVVPYTEASAQSTAESKSRVSKLGLETEAESCISALESQITELKSLLLANKNQKASQSPLFRQSTLKTDGLCRIRTGGLRRVKTEVLGGFDVFSVGDITMRKANDPSYIV